MKKSIIGFKTRRSDRFYAQSRSVLNMEIEFQMTVKLILVTKG